MRWKPIDLAHNFDKSEEEEDNIIFCFKKTQF